MTKQLAYLRALRSSGFAPGHAALRFDPADRRVLTAFAARLLADLPRSARCYHLQGAGGLKAAVREVLAQLRDASGATFVYRTDVQGYYEHVDPQILLDRAERHIRDRDQLNLLVQYLHMSVETGGNFVDAPPGLRAGGAPSPVLAAFYLYDLDCAIAAQRDVFYLRYMDDIIVLAKHRWPLRRAIATIQRHFAALGLTSHPDKTLIGRMGRGAMAEGVSFLGYQISAAGLKLSAETQRRHVEKARQLYEQCKRRQRQAAWLFADGITIAAKNRERLWAPERLRRRAYIDLHPKMTHPDWIMDRLRAYEKRFLSWATGGLKHETISTGG